MKNTLKYLGLFVSVALLVSISASASSEPKRGFYLPPNAQKVADNVFHLGSVTDSLTGEKIDGYAIIHKKGNAKGGAARPGGTATCYGFLAKGAKWRNVEPWLINTSNTAGLGSNVVSNIIANGIGKWESQVPTDILGDGSITTATLEADTLAPDDKNEVYFGPIDQKGVIGVTTVWGVFGGPTFNRRLVEWDMVFNDQDFEWSAEENGVAGKMDFDNIATHELGHAIGLADIYTSSCQAVTMYGYANGGETNKRTLEQSDIAGLNELY